MDVEHWYIGYICKILDDNNAEYHHCGVWFRLFSEDSTYSIAAVKNDNVNEVIVYKGHHISWCINTKAPIVFQGALQDFEHWLQNPQG